MIDVVKSLVEERDFSTKLVEEMGDRCCASLNPEQRAFQGQYFTPSNVAEFLASMFEIADDVRLLDPGAGVGTLSLAFVKEALSRSPKPKSLHISAWETEEKFLPTLNGVLEFCSRLSNDAHVPFSFEITANDFLENCAKELHSNDWTTSCAPNIGFSHAILNPPYRKISSDSTARKLLRECGLETSNLYTGFMWLAAQRLRPNGYFVSISPRSFCNGPYFLPFRKKFFEIMKLNRVHIFNRRNEIFSRDSILQENLVLSATRCQAEGGFVSLSKSDGVLNGTIETRITTYSKIINPTDLDKILHFSLEDIDEAVREQMEKMPAQLDQLGLKVSTGRVVDFRARDFLRNAPECGTVPLIYPMHFDKGEIQWPRRNSKKPNALIASHDTEGLLVSNGVYVLVKRFTAKEEKKRVVATVFRPVGDLAHFELVGFENHLNYYYMPNRMMDDELAKGLAIYLNSSLVDRYFRQFSGHTQVNATDLRNLRYPNLNQLRNLSRNIQSSEFDQETIDNTIQATL